MKLSLFRLLQLFLYILTSSSMTCKVAWGQVAADETINTQVNTNGNVAEITGGATRGSNLFHSFQDFSVPTGNEAFFNNADNISNIFSRVTGGNVSLIDGVIRANGNASLFLINPAGIIFGQGARLDIGGSFYGSTADSLLFEDGEFSATNLETTPLLTINAPIGLNFRDSPAEIIVNGDGNGTRLAESEIIDTQEALRVDANSTLGLIGGKINFEDATLKTAGGRVEIGSIAGGKVNLVEVANGFSLDYSEVDTFQDINLSGTSIIDASGNGGGDIQIAGRNIILQDISAIEANTLGNAPGGEVNITASESIELSGVENENNFVTVISNRVFPNGTENAGNINLETGSLSIGDRAAIVTNNSGQGNAGNIKINARDSISLTSQGNTSAILSGNLIEESATNAGNIDITTGSLAISDGAFFSTNNLGQGNTGNVTINAANNVNLINLSSINSRGSIDSSGKIKIDANSLTINNQSALFADNSGQGNAGIITLDIAENVNLGNSSIISVRGIAGSSGTIELDANSLTIDNSSQLFAANTNQGAGGNITINTTQNVDIANDSFVTVPGSPGGSIDINAQNLSLASGSNIFAGIFVNSGTADTQSGNISINLTEDLIVDGLESELSTTIGNSNFGQGNSGNVQISARNITLDNGGTISSFTSNEGNTGSITLTAFGDININGIQNNLRSGVANFVDQEGTGNSGDIIITGQNLSVTNGGQINSLVSGIANSGDVKLNIENTIRVDGFGEFISENAPQNLLASEISSSIAFDGVGNAGNIDIDTQNLVLSRNGKVNTTITQGQGNAGDININADLITIGEQGDPSISPSSIASEAATGFLDNPLLEANGGNITINTDSLLISDGGGIEVGISAIGNSGDITIKAAETVAVDGVGRSTVPEFDDTGVSTNSEIQTEIEVSSDIRANVLPNSIGNGGNIDIEAGNFSLTNNAIVTSSGSGQGNAGNINIDVAEKFIASGESLITSNIGIPQGVSATGQVGSIKLKGQEIIFSDTAQIQAGLFSGATGSPGLISVIATESISITGENTGIFSDNDPNSVGNASNTQISASSIFIDNGATIQATNQGEGNGGNIAIMADNLELGQDNQINALTVSGTGGTVTLDIADNIILRSGNLISAEAINDANGGIVDIDATFVVAFPGGNNDIVASAEQGQGGNISINAESLFGMVERPLNDSSNDINASSDVSGLDGTIDITTLDTRPIEGATDLPSNIVKLEQTITQACGSNRQIAAKNKLTINGKGGIPPAPELPLNSLNILVRDQRAEDQVNMPQAIETSLGKIQLARGVKVTKTGEIRLTAYPTDNSGARISQPRHNCRD